MKFINPFGRIVGDGVQPQACVCTTGASFASARGQESGISGCVHCGCGCGSNGEYHTGNRQVARRSIHSS